MPSPLQTANQPPLPAPAKIASMPRLPLATGRRPTPLLPKFLIVLEHANDWHDTLPEGAIIEASQFLKLDTQSIDPDTTLINLCRSYKYLSPGYYCSLLAEARGLRVLPSCKTTNDLSRKAIYSLETLALDETLNHILGAPGAGPMPIEFSLDIHFGCTDYAPLATLAQQIFEVFPAPLMRVEFERRGSWHIRAIKLSSLSTLNPQQRRHCIDALQAFKRKAWPATQRQTRRSHIAILHDPQELLPPSNAAALKRFVRVGQEMGLSVSLIEKKAFADLTNHDALFIRETTAIRHHTYLFAKKAENAGLVVIDDPESILRCTNKVFLANLLWSNGIPTPRTYVLQKTGLDDISAMEADIGYPMVMKIPDGAFSRGVSRVNSREEFQHTAQELLKHSSLILVQEYLYTEFDWRIGVLNRQAIFASQYFMSKGHWQVAKRDAKGHAEFGMARAVALAEVPPQLLAHAVHAANLIGDSLYGVDMKMTSRGPVVIEVNDNPNIDHGIEDSVLGDQLYRIVLQDLERRMALRHRHVTSD